MPAQVVPPAPGFSASQYAVVGKYCENSGSRFVRHVALLREAGIIAFGTRSRVWEMGPPLVAGELSGATRGTVSGAEVHVVGWLDLSADERDGITDWLAEEDKYDRPVGGFTQWNQYTASLDPQDEWKRDEKGVRQYRRFNCASFVLSAYREGASVELLDVVNADRLPEVGLEALTIAYGEGVRKSELRERIQLRGEGPWRVVLAGYVVHALNRPEAQVRHHPHRVTGSSEGEFPLPQSQTAVPPQGE